MPKGDFQMKQELNWLTTDPCFELDEDKEEETLLINKLIDKTPEIIMVMEMEGGPWKMNSNRVNKISHI